MKKEYINATAILLRREMGETISESENEIVNSLLKNDITFKSLANEIIANNYLSIVNEYANSEAEKRIELQITKRIAQIKQSRKAKRLHRLTLIGAAAAMIAIIITLSLQFIDTKPTFISLNNPAQSVADNIEDIILITNKGENIKLPGTTYYADNKSIDTTKKDTLLQNDIATIIVPVSKDFTIVLSDGTKIWLNSGSKLTFPNNFTGKERIVEIDGEAYFEVAHDAQRPFIVRNSVMDTKVLGTKFLITAYSTDNSRTVSLVEGSVEVSSSISDFNSKLTPGRGVVFDAEKHNFRDVEINIDNVLSRVSGMLVFENESLNTICTALMRKYGIGYTIANKKLSEKQFYIRTKKYDSIETVMELLKMAGGINYKIENNILTIY